MARGRGVRGRREEIFPVGTKKVGFFKEEKARMSAEAGVHLVRTFFDSNEGFSAETQGKVGETTSGGADI